MNKIFKTIWNAAKRCYAVVNEIRTRGKGCSVKSQTVANGTVACEITAFRHIHQPVNLDSQDTKRDGKDNCRVTPFNFKKLVTAVGTTLVPVLLLQPNGSALAASATAEELTVAAGETYTASTGMDFTTLRVSGTYVIDNTTLPVDSSDLKDLRATGIIYIYEGGTITTKGSTARSHVNSDSFISNRGTIYLDGPDIEGDASDDFSKLVSAGQIYNYEGASIYVKGNISGVIIYNYAGADIEGYFISATDELENYSTLTATSVSAPILINEGTFTASDVAASTSTTNSGLLNISGELVTGKLTNTATISASDATIAATNGLSNDSSSATINAKTITARAITQNLGSIVADNVQATDSISNSNVLSVTSSLVATTLENNEGAQLSVTEGAATISSSLVNAGTAQIASLTVGQISNSGTVSVSSTLTAQDIASNSGTISGKSIYVTDAISNTNSLTATDSLLAGSIASNAGTINAPAISILGAVSNSNTIEASKSFSAGSLSNSGSVDTTIMAVTGDITNTASTSTISATSLSAESISANAGSIEANTVNVLEDVANSGTLAATQTLMVGSLSNSGVVETSFMEVEGALSNKDEGSINANILYSMAETTNSGSMELSSYYAEGKLDISSTGELNVSTELSLQSETTNAGTLTSSGQTNIATSLTNTGTLNLASVNLESGATFTSAGDDSAEAYISNLFAEAGSTINADGGTMDVVYLSADKVTYNQTGGFFKVESGWFSNSTLNISGGTLDASENSTNSLGVNTINISGSTPISGEITDPDYISNMGLTSVLAANVTSDTTINIESGGVLVANQLSLDGETENTITVYEGGALQTYSNQFFENAGTEVYYMDATDPETGSGEIVTELLGTTNVGAVKDSVALGIDFEDGSNLIFADEAYNTSLIVNATKQLANAYDNASAITVNFTGVYMGDFTVDTIYDLIAEAESEDALDVINDPGIILSGVTLVNTRDGIGEETYRTLYVGYDQDDVTDGYAYDLSIGFQDVSQADYVYIDNGKELALTGSVLGDEGWDDASHKLLVDSDDGGTIIVYDGAFTFGSHASLSPTAGWVNEVDVKEAGEVNTKNGEFGINTATVAGIVNVASNATLHIGTVNLSGEIVNEGTTYLDALEATDDGLITNQGSLNFTQAYTLSAGTIDNYGTANFNELTVEAGQLVNNEGSVATDTTMTVAMSDNSATGISGAGQLAVDTLEVQSGVVDGSYIGKDDKSTVVNVSESGTIQNATGSIDTIKNEGYVQFNELDANTVVNGVATASSEESGDDSATEQEGGDNSTTENPDDSNQENQGDADQNQNGETTDQNGEASDGDSANTDGNASGNDSVDSSGDSSSEETGNGSDGQDANQDENQNSGDVETPDTPETTSLIATVADEPEGNEEEENSTDGDAGNGEGQSAEQTTPDDSSDGSSTEDNSATDLDNAVENGSTGEEGSDVTTPDDPEENDSTGNENNAGNSDDVNQDNGTTEDNGSSEENGSGEGNGTGSETGGNGENVGDSSGDNSNAGDENSNEANGSTTDSESSSSQTATMVVENASYGTFTNYASAEFGTLAVDTLDGNSGICERAYSIICDAYFPEFMTPFFPEIMNPVFRNL